MAKRQWNIIISGEVRCLFSKIVPFYIHKIYRKGVWKVALLATSFWGFVYTKVKIKNPGYQQFVWLLRLLKGSQK